MIIRPSPDGMSVIRTPLVEMPSDLKDYVLQEAV